jgi:hypothetical protein
VQAVGDYDREKALINPGWLLNPEWRSGQAVKKTYNQRHISGQAAGVSDSLCT